MLVFEIESGLEPKLSEKWGMEVVVLSDVSLNVNGNANVGNVLVNKVLSLMKSQIIYHQYIYCF